MTMMKSLFALHLLLWLPQHITSFCSRPVHNDCRKTSPSSPVEFLSHSRTIPTALSAQTVSEQEAKKGIDKVVAALRKDKVANAELGKLEKVNNVLGYGTPSLNSLAVRFNASFRKGGAGLSSIPLPFGLGQSNVAEGRGTMVGQVKATVDLTSGKVTSCSVFRDLGYGRAFNLKV
ncbi:predicted protein [Phaeodactylum tricornutum CCAP 1055/1]|jgi:hypothetical protein|uniref:Uncharacterized protein n=1 Tax=Phaeodactylum tricornutum (strain CCAP 1055/1) TaxID=556484 RepID=B7FU72_PHATC|nr:predicted protein [Phaeodactylum tricornutum CCAP 1055/1]EEC50212.1 predicted protein [Phaeodactylum tricornutum CCAP 1055/1]|eukprot:XP_002178547.1 predicted protein [Phaeodactylum tricornutum CCAP 1055/1]